MPVLTSVRELHLARHVERERLGVGLADAHVVVRRGVDVVAVDGVHEIVPGRRIGDAGDWQIVLALERA